MDDRDLLSKAGNFYLPGLVLLLADYDNTP